MNTDAKRYYAVLGVDPAASEEAIRGAFRRRAKDLHPDAESGDASAFILLKRAYDTLIDPEHRAAYDLSCQSTPQPSPRRPASESRRPQSYRAMPTSPPPPRSKPTRRGGVSLLRYLIAFLIMAAISLGGVQAMISLTEGPPSIQTRGPARSDTGTGTGTGTGTEVKSLLEPSTAPGSSKSGFWDPTPAAAGKKAP